jgi:hypothetical protein
MVPTGVSEDIYVQFTPTNQNENEPLAAYRYYYDTIRIHCEGDKILIPIHAIAREGALLITAFDAKN